MKLATGLLLLLAGAAHAKERDNLCFTAHKKATLQCRAPLGEGSISVYRDDQKAQKTKKLFFKPQKAGSGKLCDNKGCKRCMQPDGDMVACGDATVFSVRVNGANGVWPTQRAVLVALVLTAVPLAVFYFGGFRERDATTGIPGLQGPSAGARLLEWLLTFASAPWYPLVPALGTAINMFTIIFTGATVVLFLSAILGRPRRWAFSAVMNAAGATVGTAVLLMLVRERGIEYLNESFPTLLASPAWAKAMGWMQTYGLGGMLLVSCLPIILHPVIAFGIVSGLSNPTILTVVFVGRTIKCAAGLRAPRSALPLTRFFFLLAFSVAR